MMLFAAVLLSLALSPTPQQLSDLRLHDGFTLKYQVTVQDVRTAVLREQQVVDQQNGIKKRVAEGHMTPSQAEMYQTQALTLGKHQADEHFTITLSAWDGKLLYLSTRNGTKLNDGSGQAIVLDGALEYEADGPMNGMINADGWKSAPVYSGENVDRLAFCPLPGVGLPGVDLVQQPIRAGTTPDGHTHFRGRVPLLNVGGTDPVYKIGEIDTVSVGGHLRVVSLLVGAPAVPLEDWKMSGFRLFQDHWIAAQMQMTEYEGALASDEEPLPSNLPLYVNTYTLLEAKPEARESAAFGIETYLTKGADVFDTIGNNSRSFIYEPLGGTVKEQAEASAKKESEKDLKTP